MNTYYISLYVLVSFSPDRNDTRKS